VLPLPVATMLRRRPPPTSVRKMTLGRCGWSLPIEHGGTFGLSTVSIRKGSPADRPNRNTVLCGQQRVVWRRSKHGAVDATSRRNGSNTG